MLVFHGGRAGLSDEPDWVFLSPQQFNSSFGRAVSGAGDVNGDGYADVLVGAPKAEEIQREEGKVFLFLGSAAGLATDPAWIARGNVSDGLLGNSLSPAGDVNRDGFADVIVSAIRSTGPGTNRVRAYLFQGGRTGLQLTADWMIELDQAFAMPAITVGAAGDVNGDGYTDVGVAAWLHKSPLNREGYLRVFPGSAAGLAGSSLAPDTPDVAMAWRPRPVLLPWWRSPWAKVAGALSLIAGALAAARRFELQHWRRRLAALEREQALTRERARIARDMHDHLGATLTRLSLLSELTRRDLGPSERARVHVEQLAAGARELAGAVDEIVWAINPDKDRIENLVSYLCTYTEGFLGSAGLRCRLDLSDDLPELPLTSEARHSVFLACKEALNNVARHARATEVWLRLRVSETTLTLSIEDDGCGFAPDSAGDGRCGLANLRRRIETLGGRLRVNSQAGQGTVVWMEVPLRTAR